MSSLREEGMGLGFDPNAGPIQGPGFIVPSAAPENGQKENSGASTLSNSLAEALAVQFIAGSPLLEQPRLRAISLGAGAIEELAAGFANIGTDIWTSYLNHLAEEKERIEDYLKSPAYQYWMDQFTMQGLVAQGVKNDVASKALLNATEFNEAIHDRAQNAAKLWTNTIDGVSNFINQEHDKNAGNALFVMASFAIMATFSVGGVLSTGVVNVQPIQDAAGTVLSLVPTQLQDSFALAINLLAGGLVYFSNAEAILKTGEEKQRPPTNWESVVVFAKNVLEKVSGNMINAYLMAMLINQMEELAPDQPQKELVINRLAILAKALMLSTAAAALLKAATPDLQLTSAFFTGTLAQPLKALPGENTALLEQLKPIVTAFNQLRNETGMSEAFWDDLVASLGEFFGRNPTIDDLVNPTAVYTQLVNHLFNRDIEA